MPITLDPDLRHRMPVSFGPMPGPRQRIGGGRYADPIARIDVYSTSFLTETPALDRLLPPNFVLDGEPVVTIEFSYMSEIQWLAGRGYNTVGVRIPARYDGPEESVRGSFLSVLWENKADPIITGRDELGYAKLFCDIHTPRVIQDRHICAAGWEGHTFLELEFNSLVRCELRPAPPSDGTLHYRYIPRVGVPGQADFEGAIITPPVAPAETLFYAEGQSEIRVIQSTWEQLPTLVHIVDELRSLPVLESRGASLKSVRRDVENTQQRILK